MRTKERVGETAGRVSFSVATVSMVGFVAGLIPYGVVATIIFASGGYYLGAKEIGKQKKK